MSSPRDAASARRVDILTRVMSGGDIDDILEFIHVKNKGVSLLEWHTKFSTPPAKDALVSGRDRGFKDRDVFSSEEWRLVFNSVWDSLYKKPLASAGEKDDPLVGLLEENLAK